MQGRGKHRTTIAWGQISSFLIKRKRDDTENHLGFLPCSFPNKFWINRLEHDLCSRTVSVARNRTGMFDMTTWLTKLFVSWISPVCCRHQRCVHHDHVCSHAVGAGALAVSSETKPKRVVYLCFFFLQEVEALTWLID